ncbi:MAG: alkaline phosphatase family protein [Campylobacterales bacterium]|nr:alkaline phosphatase family protein [Campylobacterales bacterium]
MKTLLHVSLLALWFPLHAIETIAFGSCANQYHDQPIWHTIAKHKPELMIMLGDNVYADVEDAWIEEARIKGRSKALDAKVTRHIQTQYDALSTNEGFKALRSTIPFVTTWDDHDFGKDDMGGDFPFIDRSREIFLQFWQADQNAQSDGVYSAYMYGEAGKRVQVILLDSRTMRTTQFRVDEATYKERQKRQMGPYLANPDTQAQMLGAQQWRWLEEQLRQEADLRIIGFSIQFLADFTGWESWANFPKERERLLSLIASTRAEHVVMLSGDTHWAELSHLHDSRSYGLWELTSSGLSEEWSDVSPNQNRVGTPYAKANFGLIRIDWKARRVTLEVRNVGDEAIITQNIPFETMEF